MGLETEPGSQNKLYGVLKERGIEAYVTLGGHDVVCRSPPFADLPEFRKTVDGILFTTEGGPGLLSPTQRPTSSWTIFESSRLRNQHPFVSSVQESCPPETYLTKWSKASMI
jgi:hypothetical protein